MTTLHVPAQRPGPTHASTPAQGPVQAPEAAQAPEPVLVDLGWRRILQVSVARATLALTLSLVVWSLLPLLAGMTPRVILSGSMEPRIHVGDVVVTRAVPAASLTKGQVITVVDPDHPGRTRTHRLYRRAADGTIVTKGDNNPQPDSSHISPANVLGLAVIRVPFIGRPAYWVTMHNYLALAGTAMALSWAGALAFSATRRERRGEELDPEDPEDLDDLDDSDHTDDHRVDAGSRRDRLRARRNRRSRRVRQATAVALVTAVIVGLAVGPAQAAFKRTAVNPTSNLAAASTFHPYRTAVTADSPAFYWRLDATSGTVVDDQTSNNLDGALASAASSWGQAGALTSENGTALKVSQAEVTANAAVTGPTAFSVEAWVKTTSTAGGRILGFGNASGTTGSTTVDRQLYLGTNGKAYFGIGSAKTVVPSTSVINNGAWHHLVGTYATGTNNMKLYVDGVLQGSATATTVSMSGYWRAGAESMTGWTSNPGSYFDGTLDELAVYGTALTATRVQAHYAAASS